MSCRTELSLTLSVYLTIEISNFIGKNKGGNGFVREIFEWLINQFDIKI